MYLRSLCRRETAYSLNYQISLGRYTVTWYSLLVIRSFRGKVGEDLWGGRTPKGFPAMLVRPALRKLSMLHAAISLEDLAAVPGNRLEKLRGDRQGQHSVRINDRWRICFVWQGNDAHDVEVCDYH